MQGKFIEIFFFRDDIFIYISIHGNIYITLRIFIAMHYSFMIHCLDINLLVMFNPNPTNLTLTLTQHVYLHLVLTLPFPNPSLTQHATILHPSLLTA